MKAPCACPGGFGRETPIPCRLNELAILITARHWTSQYEWFANLPLALKAGPDPKLADQLRVNKRPEGMKPDEAMRYVLHRTASRQERE